MQLRFETTLSANEYVATQGWHTAVLPSCPLHPQGGCSLARHGTYTRTTPVGMRIPRWYCPQGHRTFSLLPDFLISSRAIYLEHLLHWNVLSCKLSNLTVLNKRPILYAWMTLLYQALYAGFVDGLSSYKRY